MVAELDGAEFWLPAEFFNDDLNTERSRSLAVKAELFTAPNIPRSAQPKSTTGRGNDEVNRNGELIRRLAQTFLSENRGFSTYSYTIPAQETAMWPILSRESPNHHVSSPAKTEIEMDLIYAAAWEIMRMRQMEHKFHGRSRLKKSEIPFTGFMSFPCLTNQQLQLFQLKRQQLIKQQLAAAGIQNRTAMASPPPEKMKAVQLEVRGNRRLSAGTGVFLPKREDIPNEALKKPAAFSVLPARDLQTLKLNLEDKGFYRPCFERYAVDYKLDSKKCYQQQYEHFPAPAPAAVTSPDVLLPTEWTY